MNFCDSDSYSYSDSYSKTMDRLDTFQGLPLKIIHKKNLFVTLIRSDGVPNDIYNSRKVVHVQTYNGVFEIFYNDELMPIVRTINGAWYYVGNIKTTIYEILSHFGCAHFILKTAFDYESNILVPNNDMLFNPVSSSHMLTLVEPY